MERPKVGVGVFVKKAGRILVGKRKGSHGQGTWALPGGHLEGGESFEACCRREVLEETSLIIRNIRPLLFTNDVFAQENLHYVTLFFTADHESGEVTRREPRKCEEWKWVSVRQVPEPVFLPLRNALVRISEARLVV